MDQSFQHEKPPARINLFLEVTTDGAKEEKELPLRLLVMGDFLGRETGEPLADRKPINVNKDTFQKVLNSSNLEAEYSVTDKLRGGKNEMKVHLKFDSLDAFNPDQVARQIPQLSKLLAARNLLQDLRNRLITESDFRRKLEEVINDDDLRKKLLSELDQVVSEKPKSGTEEASKTGEQDGQ